MNALAWRRSGYIDGRKKPASAGKDGNDFITQYFCLSLIDLVPVLLMADEFNELPVLL
ncbi:hypothetical protein ABN080_09665 [Proteus sp. fly-1089]|uniref:hypothetical protein n=1 Tax=Proteus sp. fly-1089 TaxID=3136675 RepID=UPI0032DA9312